MKTPEHGIPDNIPSTTGKEPETAPTSGSGGGPHASSGASPCSDRADSSRQARAVQLAHAELRRQPEIREELVADLKRRVQGGAFKVDGERVAAKLLQKIDFG
ncbi:MAG: flagellar biosynthesis anti-sigma factor FlgM [Candidatus Methylomirabilales bacterium]